MNFDFGYVFSRSAKILWKYKALWVFGILSSCSRWGINLDNITNRSNNRGNSGLPPAIEQARVWLEAHPFVIAGLVIATILLAFLSILIGTVGRVGLIKGALKVEGGAEALPFGETWSESIPYFWRVFGLSFFISVFFIFLVYLPLFVFGFLTAGIGFICLTPIFCLLIPVGIVINQVVELGNVSIVNNDLGIMEAFKRGWTLFRNNIGPVLVMALVLGVISTIVNFILALPIFGIAVPTFLAYGISDQQNNLPLILGGVCFALYLPVYWFVLSLVNSYRGIAWTLVYQQVTKPTPENNTPILETNA